MKIPALPHRWDVSPKRAIAIQRELATRVVPSGNPDCRIAVGVDAAYTRDKRSCIAAAVAWDVARREVLENQVAVRPLRFPYVPGLLSFREAPAVLAALRRLRTTPDVVLCDGHGYAHPRRFGIGCHVGVLADVPTLGCGKSRLVGEHSEPGPERGDHCPLEHNGEVIATVLRTRTRVKPVFVSVGHRLDLMAAARIVLECHGGYRLPEPVRRADRLVAETKKHAP